MSSTDRRAPGEAAAQSHESAGSAPAPATGNSTSVLVQRKIQQRAIQRRAASDPVQRFSQAGAGEPGPGDVQQAAQAGVGSGGGALPHAAEIQKSFGAGHDVSGIQAHVGGAAAQASEAIGAEAYATGNSVAFKESPSLHLAAHEAAHVMQQKEGVQLSGGVGAQGDAYEQHADAVADRVVRGESAAELLGSSPGGGGSGSGSVQRYTEYNKKEQAKGSWKTAHGPARVADDGSMAVGQESYMGSQWFWADPSQIASASSKLEAANSGIRLIGGSSKISGPVPSHPTTQKTLTQVQPKNVENKTRGKGMDLPADCGKAAGTVMGVGKGKNSDIRKALYHDEGGAAQTAEGDPQDMKWKILTPYLKGAKGSDGHPVWGATEEGQAKVFRDKMADLVGKWHAAATDAEKKLIADAYTDVRNELDMVYATALKKLTENQRLEIAKKAGINEFAAPKVGQAYVVSSGGDPKLDEKGKPNMTWNYHWGGVVMQGGADNVTLENYATGVPDEQNKEWVFQMYGAPNAAGDKPKAGQSFHEQTRDVHEQHGDMPTTMAVEPKPK